MRALSIRQPWAWLIVNGYKDVENRDWPTHFRGPVLIHAGKTLEPTEALARDLEEEFGISLPPDDEFERGGIVGIAEVVDCVRASSSPWFVGEYGFLIRNARPLPFYPMRGKLSFFDCPEYVVPDQIIMRARRSGKSTLAAQEKAEYVKRQGQTRDHHCHWPGCNKQVPPAMWGCKSHWFKLPLHLRNRIWATYQPGQEITMTPSADYLDAADEVQRWIADYEAAERQRTGEPS